MTALLDTSVIVRYLTLDPPEQGRAAQELIDGDTELHVPVVALAESAFVLMRLYGLSQPEVVDLLTGLLTRVNVNVFEVPTWLAREALALCRPSRRVSFADALIWAAARATPAEVHTFDRRFPSAGIERHLLTAPT